MSKQNNIKVKITITSNNGQQVLYRTGCNASQLVRKECEKAKKAHAYVKWEVVKKHNDKQEVIMSLITKTNTLWEGIQEVVAYAKETYEILMATDKIDQVVFTKEGLFMVTVIVNQDGKMKVEIQTLQEV